MKKLSIAFEPERVHCLLRKHRITVKDFSVITGISRPKLSGILSGRTIPFKDEAEAIEAGICSVCNQSKA